MYSCINENDKQTYAIKIINKKKMNSRFNASRKLFSFLETEMAVLKKMVRFHLKTGLNTFIGSP